MKNLKKAAERIKKAIERKENIVLYGDSDLDGVTSAILLKETIEKYGLSPSVYLSDREKRGYGLSKEAVLSIKKESPALLVSLDCGITNFEGAREAKKQGFEVIIVDHHKTLSLLPEASIILDPMQEGDDYPFKRVANAVIVFKLVKEILGDDFRETKDRFLMLTSLAIIADMVPQKEDNKEILDEGVPLLLSSKEAPFSFMREHIGENFVEKAVSLMNITKSRGSVNDCFLLLNTKEKKEIERILGILEKDYRLRQKEIDSAAEEILQRVSEEDVVIFEEGDFLSHSAGSIASRIIRKHKKPIFLCANEGEFNSGSARVPSGYDAVEAMDHCKDYLETYGGHPVAAGFKVRKENIEKFKKCLINYFNEKNNYLH